MTGRLASDVRGFSLIELLIATGVLLAVMASVFGAVSPAQGSFRVQSEKTDLQQRLRVTVDTLTTNLMLAGAGPAQGPDTGAFHRYFAALLPYRLGRRSPDPAGTFKSDTVTLLTTNPGATQTTIAQPLGARSGTLQVNSGPGCPTGDPVCGFKVGMDVIVFDDSGAFDLFTVSSIQGNILNVLHNMRDSTRTYAANTSHVVEATSRTFYLKTDRVTDTVQLMQYGGAGGADVPVVDHVVGLSFTYLGEPITTSVGPELSPIGSGELVDGPWRPDAVDPNRYDEDLLRVRAVAITVRVEASATSLRGPAGSLFTRGGSASTARALLPDQEMQFVVAPRNLNIARPE